MFGPANRPPSFLIHLLLASSERITPIQRCQHFPTSSRGPRIPDHLDLEETSSHLEEVSHTLPFQGSTRTTLHPQGVLDFEETALVQPAVDAKKQIHEGHPCNRPEDVNKK